MKDKELVIARVRQILAVDKNAVDIYSDLAANMDDKSLRDKLAGLVKDEKRHCILLEKALSILEE